MIAIMRKNDNRIMNDRQGSDWPTEKKEKLMKLQSDFENTPETDSQRRQELQTVITVLQNQWENWLLKRREICAKQYGGVAAEYLTIDVPKESEKAFMTARFIEIDENRLTFDINPLYYIKESKITCTSGWVHENERLLKDDITDFSGEILTEPLFFQLWYVQNTATQEINIQLLIRQEDEEFSDLPDNLIKRAIFPICEGRVNIDHSITLGKF